MAGLGWVGASPLRLQPAVNAGDFRWFGYFGAGSRQFVHRTERGIEINVPDGAGKDSVGISLKFPLTADFLIAATYEIVNSGKPQSGYGNGPGIYISSSTGSQSAALLSRLKRIDEGEVHSASFSYTDEAGQRKHGLKFEPVSGSSGTLSLERRGKVLSYYLSVGTGGPVKLIRQVEFGDAPVQTTRFTLERGGDLQGGHILWKDISIETDSPPLVAQTVSKRRAFLIAAGIGGSLILMVVWRGIDTRMKFV